METKTNKCTFKDHKEIDAICYCIECKIYMCNKCLNLHSELFTNHKSYNLDKEFKEIFSEFCSEDTHSMKLKYYCKNHNKLCCPACIAKIQDKENGQHSNCDIFKLENIEIEKKKLLEENMKYLEDISININQLINDFKSLYNKIIEHKEELKFKVSKIYTKIRTALNEMEDKVICDIDEKFKSKFLDENIIKESEKLPNKIKLSLEKGKSIINNWNHTKLISNINECIYIENNIKNIKSVYEDIKKSNLNYNLDIKINIEDDGNKLKDYINNLVEIYYDDYKYAFKKCPKEIKSSRKYIISGEKNNILTKSGSFGWMGTICENEFKKSRIYKWKIKVLKTKCYHIMVGVAPINFNINSSDSNNSGWYFNCYNSTIKSGPPHNYCNETNLGKVKDEIIIVMDMNKRTLKFIIDNEDKGDSYTNIPIDTPITPAVLLSDENDSVEIIKC